MDMFYDHRQHIIRLFSSGQLENRHPGPEFWCHTDKDWKKIINAPEIEGLYGIGDFDEANGDYVFFMRYFEQIYLWADERVDKITTVEGLDSFDYLCYSREPRGFELYDFESGTVLYLTDTLSIKGRYSIAPIYFLRIECIMKNNLNGELVVLAWTGEKPKEQMPLTGDMPLLYGSNSLSLCLLKDGAWDCSLLEGFASHTKLIESFGGVIDEKRGVPIFFLLVFDREKEMRLVKMFEYNESTQHIEIVKTANMPEDIAGGCVQTYSTYNESIILYAVRDPSKSFGKIGKPGNGYLWRITYDEGQSEYVWHPLD